MSGEFSGYLDWKIQKHLPHALAERVHPKRSGAAAWKRPIKKEIECLDSRHAEALHRTCDQMGKILAHGRRSQLTPNQGKIFRPARNDTDVGTLALVAAPRIGKCDQRYQITSLLREYGRVLAAAGAAESSCEDSGISTARTWSSIISVIRYGSASAPEN